MWRTYCCLTSFFTIVDMCPNCEDIARQICAMVSRWRFLATFASCILSEPRAARFRHASKIRTKATPCAQVSHTSTLRRLRLGEEKEEERKNKRRYENIYGLPYYIGRP